MKIVVEEVFLENFLLMFFVLRTISFIFHERARFVFLSCVLSGVMTTLIPLLYLSPIGNFLLEAGLGLIFICLSFNFSNLKRFVLLFCGYYATAGLQRS